VGVISNPNRRQFAGAEQGRKRRGVAAGGFDAVARPRRHKRWSDNDAVIPPLSIPAGFAGWNLWPATPKHGDLPMQAIAARSRFVAKSKLAVLGGQTIDHFGNRVRPAQDFSDKAHLAAPAALGDRDEIVFLCVSIAT